MNRYIFNAATLLAFFIIINSCGKKKKELVIPDNVIKQELMVNILADVHIAEATINLRNVAAPDVRNLNAGVYKNVFNKYKITAEQFTVSYNFYSSNTQLFNEMYNSVIIELNKMQAQGEKKK